MPSSVLYEVPHKKWGSDLQAGSLINAMAS